MWKQAGKDTLSYFGWNVKNISWPILYGFGLLIYWQWKGDMAVKEEIAVFLAFGLAPVGIFAILVFFWNVVKQYHYRQFSKESVIQPNAQSLTHKPNYAAIWLGQDNIYIKNETGLYKYEKELDNNSSLLVIEGAVQFNSIQPIQVDSVELEIDGQLTSSGWEADLLTQFGFSWGLNFVVPNSVKRGKQIAKLRSIINKTVYYDDPFVLDLPERPA